MKKKLKKQIKNFIYILNSIKRFSIRKKKFERINKLTILMF